MLDLGFNKSCISWQPHPTLAPLPSLDQVAHALLSMPVGDDALAAPWLRKGDIPFWFSRSSFSLALIAKLRQNLYKEDICIWLPDYFCNSSIAPLRARGLNLRFYAVDDMLAPAPEYLRTLELDCSPDLFVLVHYFGQPQPTASVKEFCLRHDCWLVEDAVHVLRPIDGVGEVGDFVLYSPHKHLPIPNGAVLLLRSEGIHQLARDSSIVEGLKRIHKEELATTIQGLGPVRWVVKRLMQRMGIRKPVPVIDFIDVLETATHETDFNVRMSSFSKRLLYSLLPKLDQIALKREQCAGEWDSALMPLKESLRPLRRDVTPYLAGFELENESLARDVARYWSRCGLPMTRWPDLPPELSSHPHVHSQAIRHCLGSIYLPVHASISSNLIKKFGKRILSASCADWSIEALDQQSWLKYWDACSQTNLLQSWEYGESKAVAEGWKQVRLLIRDAHGDAVAIVQALTKGMPGIGAVARINRGPLVVQEQDKYSQVDKGLQAIETLLQKGKSLQWRYLSIAPDLEDLPIVNHSLRSIGFKKRETPSWSSARLDLSLSEDALIRQLNGKWRNGLRKSEKSGVTVSLGENNEENIAYMLAGYAELQATKGFRGLSSNLLIELARQRGQGWEFSHFKATPSDVDPENDASLNLGLLVSIRSGDTATYLIGLTSEAGRKVQANSAMLWHAILHAKKCGCRWFDVGGVDEDRTTAVAKFKLGLNPERYCLTGEWGKLIF